MTFFVIIIIFWSVTLKAKFSESPVLYLYKLSVQFTSLQHTLLPYFTEKWNKYIKIGTQRIHVVSHGG